MDRETGSEYLWGSSNGAQLGVSSYTGSSGPYHIQLSDKLSNDGSPLSASIADETAFLYILSWDPATGSYALYSNTGNSTSTYTGGTLRKNVQDAGIEERKFIVGGTWGTSVVKGAGYAGGERIKSFAYGITNGLMDSSYANAVIDYYETLHGADYTP
jgi:hypothetical protein